jgi:hypothetical protein
MSDWIVRNPDVFVQLAKAITAACQNAPQQLHQFVQLLEQYKDALFIDLKETQTQVQQRKNEVQHQVENGDWKQESEARGEESQLKQKEEELKTALSSINLMLTKMKLTESRIIAMRTSSLTGISALTQMESLARTYISGGSAHNGSSSEHNHSSSDRHQDASNTLTKVGDAFHFKLDSTSQLNQHMIDALMQQAKQHNLGSRSATKVSLGNVSQSSFSMLEKNGFTIQQIAPNEFSAFKEL